MAQEEKIAYELIRSKRKTVALELRGDGTLVVRAPQAMKEMEIRRFVQSKAAWIAAKRAVLKRAQASLGGAALSESEIAQLKKAAREDLTARVEAWAPRVGVRVNRVGIRLQKRRWGSCSSAGNLSLNALLMLAPESVRDYVVVHELCHLKEMNHSPRFWQAVARVLPTYKKEVAWLKANGHALLQRIPT